VSDARQIRRLGAVCLILLAGVGLIRLFALPSIAPRVNIRWADGLGGVGRASIEERFRLLAGERREGTTWAYDLGDPSPGTVRAIVSHTAVADTHYINRRFGIVARGAPRGTSRPTGALTGWQDSPLVEWVGRLAFWTLVVAMLWLATTGRTARRERTPRTHPAM